jgi:hypothetical protein
MIQEIYKTLERPYASKYGKIVQNIILFNLLINIFVSFDGNIFRLSENTKHCFLIIEYITVAIFIIELVARYISIGFNPKYRGLKGRFFYTFTPLIMIDILTLVPYFLTNIDGSVAFARVVRFFRLFRLLKLIRVKGTVREFFSVSSFATSSILHQFLVLFILSSLFIALFSLFYNGGEKTSLMIFLDPPALADTTTNMEMVFGIIELLIGLFIGGALISIITELLTNISSDIKRGYHPYKGKNHIVIINYNSKLEFILKEINYYYEDLEQLKDVVIFLPFVKNIESFSQNLPEYSNLKIILLTGEVLNWNSYERLNINFADKILFLKQFDNDVSYLDVKVSKYLISHPKFNNHNISFVIESDEVKTIEVVYDEIFSEKYSYVIINHNSVIEQFLNRSIVEPDYFKIYSNLLTFEDFEFYHLNFTDVFSKELTFKEAYMKFTKGILIGVLKNNQTMLNPDNNMLLSKDMKLITMLKNKFEYTIVDKKNIKDLAVIELPKPNLRIDRNIVIVGDYDDIKENQIVDFLTTESIDNLKKISLPDGNYLVEDFWDNEIVNKNYDMVILNLEDDYEFILTMYLRNKYKKNKFFLYSLINIIHNPMNAKLLIDDEFRHNIILSEKLVGEYTTQVLFNPAIIEIFEEITHAYGNEFYLLERDKYDSLFKLSYEELKIILLENDMIYIGVIIDNRFIANYKNVSNSQKIVVLTEGI